MADETNSGLPPPPPGYERVPQPQASGLPPPPPGYERVQGSAPGLLESFGRGMAEGATFGYQNKLGFSKERGEESAATNPWTHFAGELAGGALPMAAAALLPTGVGQAADVARGSQLLAKGAGLARKLLVPSEITGAKSAIGQGAKLGAVYGALSGSGHANVGDQDTWQDAAAKRLYGAGAGAAEGAALGPVFAAAPPLAAGAARSLLRIPPGAFTPTVARWTENANGIFRKLGIPMSADGAHPGETPGGEAAAYSILANVLRRANVPIEQLDTLLGRIEESRRFHSNSYAPDATMLVDLDPALQKFAGSLMRDNPEVWKLAVDAMYGRQTGYTPARTGADVLAQMGIPTRPRMTPPITGGKAEKLYKTDFDTPENTPVAMGERERIGEGYKRALNIQDNKFHGHDINADMTDEQLVQLAKTASDQKYGVARAAGQGVDLRPTVEPILQRWEAAIADQPGPVRAQLARQIREVRQAIQPRGATPAGLQRVGVQGNAAAVVRGTATPFERFDNWKKYFDEDIRKYFNSDNVRNKVTGNALQTFKSELLEGVRDPNDPNKLIMPGVDHIQDNNLGNLYADARAVFSSVADARRAIQTGRDIGAGKAGLNEYRSLGKDAASQKLVRLGMHGDYMDSTANKPRTSDATKYFDNPRLEEVLSEIVPRDNPARFGQYLGNEQMMQGTARRTYQGSPTAERIADDQAAKELFNLTDQIRSGGLKSVLSNAAADALQRMFGYRADTAATLGRVLFTADPTQRALAIHNLRQYMQPGRFAYFQQIMSENARRVAQSGAVATAGNNQQP